MTRTLLIRGAAGTTVTRTGLQGDNKIDKQKKKVVKINSTKTTWMTLTNGIGLATVNLEVMKKWRQECKQLLTPCNQDMGIIWLQFPKTGKIEDYFWDSPSVQGCGLFRNRFKLKHVNLKQTYVQKCMLRKSNLFIPSP